jgi:hypothetical protein
VKKKLWSQSVARRSLLGHDTDTMNPSIAAKSLLGRVAVAKAKRTQKWKRRFHRENLSLGSIGSLVPGGGLFGGLLGGLGGRFRAPSEKRAARVAPGVIQAANAGNLVAVKGIIHRAQPGFGIAKERAVWQSALAQVKPQLVAQAQKNDKNIPEADHKNPEAFAASIAASAAMMPTAVPAAGGLSQYSSLLTPGLVTGVVRAASGSRRRSTRGRYPTYVDRYGRQRYSTKPPGTELRIPQGATPTPGTPYNFFRGAVGAGGALATAGQVALAAGAGIAAYLVTKRVLAALGGRAQAKEEAGVNAALAFRQARADFKQQQGRDPNREELQEMKAAYQQQLLELGYDPVTFTRTRSGVEEFLESYNPLGGE